jgi:hypothetical protein
MQPKLDQNHREFYSETKNAKIAKMRSSLKAKDCQLQAKTRPFQALV